MKKLFGLILGVIALSVSGYAQERNFGEDSVTCVQNLALYNDRVKENNDLAALPYWRWVFLNCPESSKKMYVDGLNIVKAAMDKVTGDELKEKAYLDTLLMVYDKRIEYYGQRGYVLGRKGVDMIRYKASYEDAEKVLSESVTLQGDESEAAVLVAYMKVLSYLEKKKLKTSAEVVDAYGTVAEIIEKQMSTDDPKEKERFEQAMAQVTSAANDYLNCEVLGSVVAEQFEAHKQDPKWLNRNAKLFISKECEGDIVYKIAEGAYALEKSDKSAYNLGKLFLKGKRYAKAEQYFTEAVSLVGEDKSNLADYYLALAKANFGEGRFETARANALKAANEKNGWGEPYYFIGELYASSLSMCSDEIDKALKTVFWVAVDMFAKAKAVDPSMAERCSAKISQYSQQFPDLQNAFFYNVEDGTTYTVGCWINTPTTVRVKK